MAEKKTSKLDGEPPKYEYNLFRSSLTQISTIVIQNVSMLSFGMSLAIPTVVIGALMSEDGGDEMMLTESEASWYGSVLLVCHPTGGLLSGFLQELIGRKWCMAAVSLPQLVGWYVLWKAGNAYELYVSCVALGLSMGLSEAPVLTYVGETVEPRLRGALSSMSTFIIILGSFVAFMMSTALPWRTIAMINMSLPIVSFVGVVLLTPESPVWLLSKNRLDEAKKSLAFLRGCANTDDVEEEFAQLMIYTGCNKSVDLEEYADCGIDTRRLSYVKYLQINANDTTNADIEMLANKNKRTGWMDTLRNFWTPEIKRPFLFMMVFFFFWSFAAFVSARPYLIFVYDGIGLPFTAQWTLVCTSILTMIGAFFNVFTVAKFGKRPITLVSMMVCALSMFGIGIYMVAETYFSFSFSWIPMILVITLFLFAGYGVFPMPWMLVSEIYPAKGRGVVSGLTAALAFLVTFVFTKSFLEMEALFTLPGVFLIYGAVTLIGTLYLYACMPETENKTLQEIEQFFVGDVDI